MFGNEYTKQELADLRSRIEYLGKRLDSHTQAFDDLFDAVAEDLGYEAALEWRYHNMLGMAQSKISPRTLARSVPESPKVIRKETARCSKKRARGA